MHSQIEGPHSGRPSETRKVSGATGRQSSAQARPTRGRPASARSVSSRDNVKGKLASASSSARPPWQRPTTARGVTIRETNKRGQEKISGVQSSARQARPAWQMPTTARSVTNARETDKGRQEKISGVQSSARPAWQRPSSARGVTIKETGKGWQEKFSGAPGSSWKTQSVSKDNAKHQEGKTSGAPAKRVRPECQRSWKTQSVSNDNNRYQKGISSNASARRARPEWDRPWRTQSVSKDNCKHQQGKMAGVVSSGKLALPGPSCAKGNVQGSIPQATEAQGASAESAISRRTLPNCPTGQARSEVMKCAQAGPSCAVNDARNGTPLGGEDSSVQTVGKGNESSVAKASVNKEGETRVSCVPSDVKQSEDIPETSTNDTLTNALNATFVLQAEQESSDTEEKSDGHESSSQAEERTTTTAAGVKLESSEVESGLLHAAVVEDAVSSHQPNENSLPDTAELTNRSEIKSQFKGIAPDEVVCVKERVGNTSSAAVAETPVVDVAAVKSSENKSRYVPAVSPVLEERDVVVELPERNKYVRTTADQCAETSASKSQHSDVSPDAQITTAKDETNGAFSEIHSHAGIVQTPRFGQEYLMGSGASYLDWIPRANSTPCTEKGARVSQNFVHDKKSLFGGNCDGSVLSSSSDDLTEQSDNFSEESR